MIDADTICRNDDMLSPRCAARFRRSSRRSARRRRLRPLRAARRVSDRARLARHSRQRHDRRAVDADDRGAQPARHARRRRPRQAACPSSRRRARNRSPRAACSPSTPLTAGADALLIVTPYYIRPPQRGLVAYYLELAAGHDVPWMVYHIPGRTAVGVTLDTLKARQGQVAALRRHQARRQRSRLRVGMPARARPRLQSVRRASRSSASR